MSRRVFPSAVLQRRTYKDISVTVLRPVHSGDSRTLAQLGAVFGLWMTVLMSVCPMLRRWGRKRHVH